MIVCTECGHRNEDADDFCGSCGNFLEFTGERIEEAGPPAPEPEVPAEHSPTIVERVRTAVGLDRDEPAGDASTGADSSATAGEGSPTPADDTTVPTGSVSRARREAERAADEAARAAEEARRAAEQAAEEAAAEASKADDAARAAAAESEARQAAEATAASAQVEAVAAAEAEVVAQVAREQSARAEADAARAEAEERARTAEAARVEAEARAAEAERAARMVALVAQPAASTPVPSATDRLTTPPAAPAPSEAAVAPTDTGEKRLAAQKPQKAERRRARLAPAEVEPINPGDLICGQCGVGNEPTRNFCRRCGATLVAAEVAAKPPWYRRIFRRKPKAKPLAGTRNAGATGTASRHGPSAVTRGKYAFLKFKSLKGKVGRIMVIVGILGVVVFSFGPGRDTVDDWYHSVKRLVFPEYDPVRPVAVSATSELDGHPAAAAIDQIKNSYWAEGAEGNGEGQGLVFDFEEPIDLAKVGFTSGASSKPEDFVTQPRIRELQLLFDDGTTKTVELADKADFQSFDVERSGVTQVQLQIISVYPSLEGHAASLAEIEFFIKR